MKESQRLERKREKKKVSLVLGVCGCVGECVGVLAGPAG